MKKVIILFFIFLLLLSIINISLAKEDGSTTEETLKSQQEEFKIEEFLENSKQYQNEFFEDTNMDKILENALKGKIDNQTILEKVLMLFGKEVTTNIKAIISILAIIVIHSILKSISDSLENGNISKIVYYVQYILIVTIIMTNFSDIIKLVQDTTTNLVGLMNMLVPLLITLMLYTRQFNNKYGVRANNIIYDKFYWKSNSKLTYSIGFGIYKSCYYI